MAMNAMRWKMHNGHGSMPSWNWTKYAYASIAAQTMNPRKNCARNEDIRPDAFMATYYLGEGTDGAAGSARLWRKVPDEHAQRQTDRQKRPKCRSRRLDTAVERFAKSQPERDQRQRIARLDHPRRCQQKCAQRINGPRRAR